MELFRIIFHEKVTIGKGYSPKSDQILTKFELKLLRLKIERIFC